MAHELVCWKCGADLAALSLPLSRRDECARCRAELHVCRMCVEYDTSVAKHCREPTAEEVSDKQAANFCDFFRPRPGAWSAHSTRAADQARSELERLFGKN
jgi:ribosome-binding protein aMBF1 (putative translation factor)